ncbi:YadA C-terminal domain-containing protein [Enterobacter bugandensis]|uniref:YadA C-terminal domain-containing protein n=1 Tax=Enterobacter bugandensis TaxID=881260 RepID=UPI000797BA2B|nr:YadA C-terminal domain-containing protein [Enterobacter bugandensis]SAI60943.1 YadA domain-containing protein [Enterobacter bugandensis]
MKKSILSFVIASVIAPIATSTNADTGSYITTPVNVSNAQSNSHKAIAEMNHWRNVYNSAPESERSYAASKLDAATRAAQTAVMAEKIAIKDWLHPQAGSESASIHDDSWKYAGEIPAKFQNENPEHKAPSNTVVASVPKVQINITSQTPEQKSPTSITPEISPSASPSPMPSAVPTQRAPHAKPVAVPAPVVKIDTGAPSNYAPYAIPQAIPTAGAYQVSPTEITAVAKPAAIPSKVEEEQIPSQIKPLATPAAVPSKPAEQAVPVAAPQAIPAAVPNAPVVTATVTPNRAPIATPAVVPSKPAEQAVPVAAPQAIPAAVPNAPVVTATVTPNRAPIATPAAVPSKPAEQAVPVDSVNTQTDNWKYNNETPAKFHNEVVAKYQNEVAATNRMANTSGRAKYAVPVIVDASVTGNNGTFIVEGQNGVTYDLDGLKVQSEHAYTNTLTLSNQLTQEKQDRTDAESQITSDLQDEGKTRADADVQLQKEIDVKADAAQVNQLAITSHAYDLVVEGKADANTKDIAVNRAAIASKVDQAAVDTSVKAETNRAIQAEGDLDKRVTFNHTETLDLERSINSVKIDDIKRDQTIAGNTQLVKTEEVTRKAQINKLDNDISGETSRAISAEKMNAKGIATNTAAIAQKADTSTVSAIETKVATNAKDLSTETQRAIMAETANEANISLNAGAISDNTAKIDNVSNDVNRNAQLEDTHFKTLQTAVSQKVDTGTYQQRAADVDQRIAERKAEQEKTDKVVASHTAELSDHEARISDLESRNQTNFGKLKNQVESNRKRASAGIAGVAAIATIPQVLESQSFNLGAGVGNTDNESALAVGFSARVSQSTVIKAAVSNDTQHNFVIGAGVAYGW